MRTDIAQLIRVSKRLTQAGGYLELDMPHKALECLENLGPLGPFEGQAEFLRGEAFRRQRRFQEAAHSFKVAAGKFSSPQNREAYLAMSVCYRQAGNPAQALKMLAHARGANLPKRR
jgi:tetratricopeptide (TPR) repeat protein